jgi:hypothetical protein
MLRPPFSSLVPLAALTALTLAAGCSREEGEDPSLLVGRVWVDSKPEKPTDYAHGMYVLPRPVVGLFLRSSQYDFHFERFDYKRDGQALKLTFPQSGKQAEVTFTVSACNTLPPFDLCLDLSTNPWGGPKRYYAKRQQDDDDEAAARALRAQVRVP